jgi:hypothetical protein
LQTYSNGEIVRWIGPEGSDNPAPTVALTAGDAPAASAAATPAPAQSSDSGGSDALPVIALVVGVLGLAAGSVALIASRRRTPAGA